MNYAPRQDSLFVSILGKLRSNKKAVLFFLVDHQIFQHLPYGTLDSTCGQGRRSPLAGKWNSYALGIPRRPVGACLTPLGSFGMLLKEVEVNRLKDPPPPKPKPKNPPKKVPHHLPARPKSALSWTRRTTFYRTGYLTVASLPLMG